VKQKAKQIKQIIYKLYWLIGKHSKLSLSYKRRVYITIIKPIWTYGIQLWGCTKRSNRLIIQKSQNKILRLITNAYRYVTNEELHEDLNIKQVDEVILEHAIKHETRLQHHPNTEAILLMDSSNKIRRLQRSKPQDLTTLD